MTGCTEMQDIIRPYDKAIGTDGSIAILRGNLASEGAVIKHTACPKEMFKSVLRARPFDSEEECLDAVLKHKVQISRIATNQKINCKNL